MTVATLADLVFRVREVAAGHGALISVWRAAGGERLSTTDFTGQVHSLALALEGRGVAAGDRVAIFAESRPEWHVVDLACQLLGAATVPIHPRRPRRQVAYILRNSGSTWVFYGDARQRDLLHEVESALTHGPSLVAFDGDAAAEGGMSITRLLGEGAERRGDVPIERFRGRVSPDDLSSLIYTSGTTGDPKGVMLSHRSSVVSFRACADIFSLTPTDVAMSVLPLAHLFQRTVDHLCLYRGTPIHQLPDLADLAPALADLRPTLLAAGPDVYEEIYRQTRLELKDASAWKRRRLRWALGVGRRYAAARRSGFIGPLLAAQRLLAARLALVAIKRRFGGRLRFVVSGGAPIAREVGEFFEAAGLPLFQGYGLAEVSPILATNAPRQQRAGSVGKPLSEVELRIAEDGEILTRGPAVMDGYWGNPRATADSIDDSGWLHTGDVGEIDRSGYLFVRGRKEHLLRTAEGEPLAPQPIEKLLAASPLVARAVVVGDGRTTLGALIVADADAAFAALPELASLAVAERLVHPALAEQVGAVIDRVNAELPGAQRLGGFRLLPRDLSVADGELTHDGKLRRQVVLQRYADLIADLDRPADGA